MTSRARSAQAAAIAALTAAAFVAACTSASPARPRTHRPLPTTGQQRTSAPSSSTPATPTTSSAGSTGTSSSASPNIPPPPPTRPQRILAAMSLRQRAGQLLMVDCPSTSVAGATVSAISRYGVGSVILDGTSTAGLARTQTVTAQLRNLAPRRVGLFIATDQEGGEVQRLQGPGFSSIPSGVVQGETPPARLQREARTWAGQLYRAGVNVNLAPVLDVVPAHFGSNPPIGDLDRELGHTPAAVRAHGVALVRGMAAGHVVATAKHFPGLGRVRGNTDTTSGVTDTVTTRHDRYLAPFRAAIAAGVPFLMMSTAIYTRIDPRRPAAFSPTIVTGMARHDLGFSGVIISDDLGAAAQVASYPVGQRAVDFVAAGGDIVLTVDANQAAAMTSALVHRARQDPAFRRRLNAAALTVLQAKDAHGLLR
ncbi:MAG TPA: glycoside hydrolase family 3 N-terminal domain-containing protein [Jatrophihabitans sp.]|nr:glycoside hydrolase family 3 N-terminal domain-containing protein [Jatrophihabitans sp.]